MIFSYFQFLVYILFFNTQRLKQFNVLFCCCPREQLCLDTTFCPHILIPCTPACTSIGNTVNFSVQRCALTLLKYWKFGVKVTTFMLTNTILRQLFLCPTATSAPKLIADAPCSDVAHHSAAPRCGAYPSSLPAPDAVRGNLGFEQG